MSDATITVLPPKERNGRASATGMAFGLAPGLLLTMAIAGLAYVLRKVPGIDTFSPMILAILLGILFHNIVGTPARAKGGVVFSLRRILRLAIILLGLQLTASQVAAVGGTGIGIIVVTLIATFTLTKAMGRVLGVERKLAELIAAGTSICGASAVIATNTVTEGSDEDVAYAVACVTVFGTLSMFLYPALGTLIHLDMHHYGLWAGSSIHEIAQVVAAAFQHGKEAGDFGTIAKLSRVMLLAPLVMTLGIIAVRRGAGASGAKAGRKTPMPWFVLGFIAMIGVNSLGVIPADATHAVTPVTTFLLTMALAAMGLETDIRKLRAKGVRPLALGALSWVFISCFSLALILTIG
ncbi:MAG: YeiH family protein [Rhizobiaceae bacterium]